MLRNDFNYLVVDDGSPDGTADICEKLKSEIRHLEIMRRSKKSGLGSAYRDGYRYALEKNFDAIIQIDADGSHQVSDLPKLLSQFESKPKVDLAIGSRWIKGGSVLNWSKHREALSRLANIYSNFLLGLGVKDSTAGFRVYKTGAIKKLNLGNIKSEGYCFQIEMTREIKKVGGIISEVPITFVERQFGKSKMSGNIVIEAMLRVTYWGLLRVFRK
ncbi:dolichyl-phosphate beta-D-mannosyltransferase [Candidatus Nanopelagicaceae bacterium]